MTSEKVKGTLSLNFNEEDLQEKAINLNKRPQ